MAVRKKREEKLSESNINKVIELLAAEKPITKKEACEILHIAYNTTRLNKIILDHQETLEFRARRKAQNKGKGVTEAEKVSIVKHYVDGNNISDIAKALYRSPAFIKAVIERLGVPQKLPDTDYKGIREAMIPEPCVSEEFEIGEKVEIINIEAKSQSTTLFKLMELVLLGDLFSLSLADELNMIPEDIEGIENLKKLLED